jgi:sortase A
VLILLFVAYQLWGTGLYTSRQQDSLRSQFKQKAKVVDPAGATTSTTLDPLHLPPPPPSGESVANIRIPKIGVDKYVVQGVGLADLRKGPGHYPGTPLPGEQGNAAIAGHRTTYGAPFRRVDELSPGSRIILRMPYGRFTYKVTGSRITTPSDASALVSHAGTSRLVLTACHPLYSAAKRIVVSARLASATPA